MQKIDDNVTSVNITKLLPDQPYNVWVRAYATNKRYSESNPLKVVTLPDPEKIVLISTTSKSLTVEWEPYSRATKYIMKFRPGHDDSLEEVILDSSLKHRINNANVHYTGKKVTVLNLHPKTEYQFWLSFLFENRSDPYNWPRSDRFIFETLADRPNPPGKPEVVHLRGDVYKVTWTAAEGNGAMIEEYSLEGLQYRVLNRASRSTNSSENNNQTLVTNTLITVPLTVEDPEPIADSWKVYYKGNDTYWIIKDLSADLGQYSFRVRARNMHGWSEYSVVSERVTGIPVVDNPESLIVAVAAPALITIVIVTFSCLFCGELHCLLLIISIELITNLYFFPYFSIQTSNIRQKEFPRHKYGSR